MAQRTGLANILTHLDLAVFSPSPAYVNPAPMPEAHATVGTRPSPAPSLTIIEDDEEWRQQITHALHVAHVQVFPHVAGIPGTESL